jgi:antirestriction protein ArdC
LGYALGELAAEIASCYVAAELGVPQGEGLGNHAAYLRSWLDAMKGDRNYIFKASKQASKVTDFLLNFVKQPEPAGAVQ